MHLHATLGLKISSPSADMHHRLRVGLSGAVGKRFPRVSGKSKHSIPVAVLWQHHFYPSSALDTAMATHNLWCLMRPLMFIPEGTRDAVHSLPSVSTGGCCRDGKCLPKCFKSAQVGSFLNPQICDMVIFMSFRATL